MSNNLVTALAANSTSKTITSTIADTIKFPDENINLITKITAVIVITAITLICGFIPLICTTCRSSTKILGLANAFSGGLFMGIALFHLLPESNEHFEDYFSQVDPDSTWKKLPCTFFIAFISYSLILLVEKVAFDSHSLTEHDHGAHHSIHHSHMSGHKSLYSGEHNPDLTETLLDKKAQQPDGLVNKATSPISSILKNMKEINPIEEQVEHEHEHEHENHKEETHKYNHNHDQEDKEQLLQRDRGASKVSRLSSTSSIHNLRPIDIANKTSLEFKRNRNLTDAIESRNKNSLADDMALGRKKRTERGYEEDEEEPYTTESEEEDDDEQTMKNVVSSKGKFASYLHARSIMQSPTRPMKVDRSLFTASKILERAQARRQGSIDRDCITNLPYPESRKESLRKISDKLEKPTEIKESDEVITLTPSEEHSHPNSDKHHFNPKSNLTPYLLLVALSIHGLFEGTALGVQENYRDAVFLAIAIVAHKWAEAFTLGVSFSKSNVDNGTFIRMITLFAAFTPVGILSGMILIDYDPLLQGVFLAISSGTFIYISASEVIVEEFAVTKYRYQKYFLYLCGGILVALLSYLEVS